MRNGTFFLIASILLTSCEHKTQQTEEMDTEESVESQDRSPESVLKVTTLMGESFPDASLELYRPLGNEQFPPGRVPFEFNIKNYRFGRENPMMLAINGGNPESHTQALFSKPFNTGTYRAVAFLTDKQGFVLKEYGNYVDRDFIVGNSSPIPAGDEPYLMVNLPRNGEEWAKEDPLIVDFLVIGGEMEADQLEVVLEIGEFTHKTSKLEPLSIEGLSEGDYVLYMHLLRKDGKTLDNIFSSVRRDFVIK